MGERGRIWRVGSDWILLWDGVERRVRDNRGLNHLALLISRPGTEMHVMELVTAGSPAAEQAASDATVARPQGVGPALDDAAKAQYRERVIELEAAIADAERDHDVEREARARSELDFLLDELSAAVGRRGRDRPVGDPAERARQSVGKAISRALKAIDKESPALAAHLDRTVKRGYLCAYDPDDVLVSVGRPPHGEARRAAEPTDRLDVRLLGPIEVRIGSAVVATGSSAAGRLLARLALRVGSPVTIATATGVVKPDALDATLAEIDQIFADTGVTVRQVDDTLILAADEDLVDVNRLRSAARRARDAQAGGDHEAAVSIGRQALAEWREDPASTLEPLGSPADAVAAEAAELRLSLAMVVGRSMIEIGAADDVPAVLHSACADHPDHGGLVVLVATALDRAGRRLDALGVVQDHIDRRHDSGVSATDEVARLARRLLSQASVVEGVSDPHLVSVGPAARRWNLLGDRMTIGSDPANEIVLDDATVSRLHALMERMPAGWLVADLGSRNGVHVNGDRLVGPRTLRDGDQVQMGSTTVIFRETRPSPTTATAVEQP